MNVYERILNILLEARVDMFIQDRLDEAKLKGKQGKLDVNKNKKLDAEDFKMLRSGKRADEGVIKARNKAMKNAFISKIRHQEAPGAGLSSREKDAAHDHEVRLAGAKKKPRFPTPQSEKQAVGRDNLRQGDTYNESSEQAKANKAKQQALKQDRGHRVDKLLKGRFSDGGISANALKKAGEARKSGNKPEAQRQVGRSQKMDKPQIP
jgi:hypothetical protein